MLQVPSAHDKAPLGRLIVPLKDGLSIIGVGADDVIRAPQVQPYCTRDRTVRI